MAQAPDTLVTPDTPLAGVRVVELSERGAAAYAGRCLRRMGADLLKLEPPGGDPLRRSGSPVHTAGGRTTTTTAAFDYFNEGKTTRVLDEHAVPADLARLVAGCDVFVLDIEPTRYEAYGLTVEGLASLGARIVCAITPFGLTGPYRDFAGPEIVTSAFGGMSVGIGEPHRPPLKMPLMQSAIQGGLVGSIAAMGALAGDTDTNGSVIDISESDVWATVHAGTTMVSFLFSNRLRRREGRRVQGQPYPHGLFRCKDGLIAMQASERHQWESFLDMVGNPEWGTDRRFGSRMQMSTEHADEIDEMLAPWFMARTREEIFAECRARKIPAAPVYAVDEVRGQQALLERHCLEIYTGATGVEVTVPAPPFRFRHAVLAPAGPVPVLEGE